MLDDRQQGEKTAGGKRKVRSRSEFKHRVYLRNLGLVLVSGAVVVEEEDEVVVVVGEEEAATAS